MPNKTDTQDIKIAKSQTVATWVGVIVAFIFATTSLIMSICQFISQEKHNQEAITMSVTRVIDDYPALLTNMSPGRGGVMTGTISIYWSVVVSNIGEKDISVILYNIIDVSNQSSITYSSIDQGIYSSLIPEKHLDVPFSIEAGHSIKFYIKTGMIMDNEAYKIASGNYSNYKINSINELMDTLYSNHIDFFGNEVFSPGQGFTYIAAENRKEQIFAISLVTARNTALSSLASWYEYHSGSNQN